MPHYRLAHWFALAGLLLALGACGNDPSPQTGITVKILTTDFPPQGQDVTVQAVINSEMVDIPQMNIDIGLTPGVSLANGQAHTVLDLKKQVPQTIEFTVKLADSGKQRISVIAEGLYSGATFIGMDTLFLLVDQVSTRSSREWHAFES